MKWHLLTRRMLSDGGVDENSSMSSFSGDGLLAGMRQRQVKSAEATLQPQWAQMSSDFFFFFLPFGYCCVGEAGGSKHSSEKIEEKMSRSYTYTLQGDSMIVCFLPRKAGLQGPT